MQLDVDQPPLLVRDPPHHRPPGHPAHAAWSTTCWTSRAHHRQDQPAAGTVDLNDVVRRSVETSGTLIDGAGTSSRSKCRLTADCRSTRTPPAWPRWCSNLLKNAAKYTPQGGRITLNVRVETEDAEVTVRDTGLGIDPDDRQDLRDVRAGRETAPGVVRDSGLGVGLALARQLVRLHGGRMTARSEGTGKGSEFSFRIPLAKPA